MSKAQKFVQPVLVVLALGLGVGAIRYMRSTKPEAKREAKVELGMLVEVQTVHAKTHTVEVLAQGTVVPSQRVVVQPEISGRVIAQSPQLVPGGYLKAGEMMVRIDPRDYELALSARQAEVSRAQLELQMERGRAQVAEREWKMFGELEKQDGAEAHDPEETLALRGPQLRTAQVAVQSATSALERAKLDLSRTVVQAPFNALVVEERTELGQLVTPQSQLATLVGTDSYWVQVSVPLEALSHITIPQGSSRDGSKARVWTQVGSQTIEREGRVIRLLPDLDQSGAMARVLVEIEDPLGLRDKQGDTPPLLLNSYVNVAIEARPVENAIEVPRAALREDAQVLVVDGEGLLRVRDVRIVWRMPHAVLVQGGLNDGEQLVVSRVAIPVDGMKVRTTTAAEPATPQASGAPAAPFGEGQP
jgi:RND family efflux transporter MFP subunit